MKTIILAICLLPLFACAARPVQAPSQVQAPAPILPEFEELHALHEQFLAFRENEKFRRYGFTFNSPYADWLQRVRDIDEDTARAEAARLLAGLAVAARIHGVQSEVYKQFERRFDQTLRGSVGQESLEQESVAAVPVAEESVEEESAALSPVEQEPVKQEPVAAMAVAEETVEEESAAAVDVARETAEPLPVEQDLTEQKTVEHSPVAQQTARGAAGSPAPFPVSELSILFSGDTQGVVFPQPGISGSVGGLARRTSTIAFFRGEDPGIMLLDAGDTFASGFERAEKINKALVRAMNHLRYDAMGLGCFDLAVGEVALRELAAMAKFPMLCSNLEFKEGVAPWIKPYLILERNGRRVAVLSVVPASSGVVITGARFVHPQTALKTLVPKLRSMVDYVVLLTQFGSDEAAGLLGENTLVDVILGDRSAVSRDSPAYVPAVAKGMGLGLVRLNTAASSAPARVKAIPVLLRSDFDSQLLKILDEIK
jgi:hypothetical protein